MDNLGPLPKNHKGNNYVNVVTDRYKNLKRAIPVKNTTAPHVSAIVLDHWIIPYDIPTYLLTGNGPQFVVKFLTALYALLETNKLTATEYHPQTNGKTESYNKNIVARLRHYFPEHQQDWDHYSQPVIYAYNAQVHR